MWRDASEAPARPFPADGRRGSGKWCRVEMESPIPIPSILVVKKGSNMRGRHALSAPVLLSSPLLVGLGIRRAEAVMGQDDAARGVTDRRYQRRLFAAWERFVDGAGLPSG